ncbi:MAG: hypothetical protein AAF318_02770 [Pseudomonadota bacterium]
MPATVADCTVPVVAGHRVGDVAFLTVAAPQGCAPSGPGAFALLRAVSPGAPFLGRPLSIIGGDEGLWSFAFNIIGAGTEALAALAPGENAEIVGPLGTPFGAAFLGEAPVTIVGDRTHVGTLLALAAARKGLVTRVLLRDDGSPAIPVFEDAFKTLGATASRGNTADAIALAAKGDDPLAIAGEDVLAVALQEATPEGRVAEVALHQMMGCGFGACHSCVHPLRDGTVALVCQTTVLPLHKPAFAAPTP